MKIKRAGLIIFVGAAMLGGCGDNSTEPPSYGPLRIVAGGDASDTVLAPLVQALVVEVNEGGQPLPGTVVRFQSTPVDDANQWGPYTALVSAPDRNAYTSFLSDTTDENGRAFAIVQLGTKAGPASVVITVPDLGAEDTAHFTVKPGNAASVIASPQDTTLYVGHTFAPRSAVVDRYQNPVDAAVSYKVAGTAVTFANGTVKGVELGRGELIASFNDLADTTIVSVIPEMTLGAIYGGAVVMVNSDGSGYRVLAPAVDGPPPYTTDWTPSGKELVFDHGYGTGPINVVNTDGELRTISTTDEWGLYPEVSPDGSWVYYARNIGWSWRLYRVHLDGTGEEEVPMKTPQNDVVPSLSPDGKRLVYVISGDDRLMILDLATGESTDIHVPGHSPAWSPAGDRIAYVSGNDHGLHTIAPDGSDDRNVGAVGNYYDFGIDWSPDGKWIIARNMSRNLIELVQAETALTFPLPFTASYVGPSWKGK